MEAILSDFLVQRAEGYYCKYGDFFIDPMLPVHRAVVTHAHADHASRGQDTVFCTVPTASFVRYRYRQHAARNFMETPYHQPFSIGDVILRFIPAGHMLGSAQVEMVYRGVTYLFTGDYKRQADDTCEPLETVTADVLITESTFADPRIVHPDPVEELSKINNTPHHILMGTYALGKAQRLTSLLNTHCPDRRVLVHHGILPFHRIYTALGITQLRYEPYDKRALKAGTGHLVYLVPPMAFNSYFRAIPFVRAFASGWERLQRQNDLSLYISDHVDWNDILYCIGEVKPREIWTVHGEGQHLANHFAGNIPVKRLLHL
ncbi:exonuclease [Parapedobacter sp. 10938]|uniref:exonuclease n=1 Tax=Parapedobacter flavus TaxID=3110225 RepID=UPI002DBCCCA1|nr:exonuclease [Parapedobacter sp. 10938]MEC3879724.1 exonuclease [Parapedobacter sp. 10938]